MHHGGWIKDEGKKEYVGGRVNFFDYCDADLMGLLEFEDMVETLGYIGSKQEIYSTDEDGSFFKLESDGDLLKLLGGPVLRNMYTFYVVHLYVPQPTEIDVSQVPGTQGPNTQPIDDFYNFEPFDQEKRGADNKGTTDEDPLIDVEVDKGFDAEECEFVEFDSQDDDESDATSDDLEYFPEADYEVEEDRLLFDSKIDDSVEWGGLGGVFTNTEVQATENPLQEDYNSDNEEGRIKRRKNKAKVNWPIFRQQELEADGDPKFENGCYLEIMLKFVLQ